MSEEVRNKDTSIHVALDAIQILNKLVMIVPEHWMLNNTVNILLDRLKLIMIEEGYTNE